MENSPGEPDVIIAVRGVAHAETTAERATASLSVGFDGDNRRDVRDRSTAALAVCIDSITTLHDPAAGPVVSWTADDVQVWTERPWNSEGTQLPLVFHSLAHVTVTFSDVRALTLWLEEAANRDGITVSGIAWAVTDLTRRELESRAQRDAVAHAVDKASVYAASLGLDVVTPLELSEPSVSAHPVPEDGRMFAMAGSAPVDLASAPVGVDVTIEVRFAAHSSEARAGR